MVSPRNVKKVKSIPGSAMIDPMPTTDMTADVLLRVRELSVAFPSKRLLKAVDGVSLDVWPGEILGLVGETGSGKTVFVTSILGLIRKPGRITHGSITDRKSVVEGKR